MQFSVFILISAFLLSLAFASPIPSGKGALVAVTAATKLSKTPLKPGAFVSAAPVHVKNLPILTDAKGQPKRGATISHPGVLTNKHKDGNWGIAPISHTPVPPHTDIKNIVKHPHLEGHVHVGNTKIDPKHIKPATGGRAGGKATGCEVIGLCAAQAPHTPPPKPVRSKTLR